MNDPKVMKIRGYILNTLIYRRTAIVVGMVLAAFTLTQVRLGAEPEKFTFNRGEEVKVYTANPDANSTENVKGMFKGREFQFKKFEGIHDLLSVSDKIKGEARIAPLGGKIRGGVKKGFKPGKPLKHYVNDTYSTNSPHINAESFENKSVFEAVSAVGEPYYFFNNKYFTNVGTFRVYDTFDSRNYETYENLLGEMDYDPISSKVFINKQDALMESASPNIVSGGFRIEADQINNQGKISASSAGIIHFDGGDVDFNKGLGIASATFANVIIGKHGGVIKELGNEKLDEKKLYNAGTFQIVGSALNICPESIPKNIKKDYEKKLKQLIKKRKK